MNPATADANSSHELAELIAGAVRRRADGRIADIRIDRTPESLVVQGRCQSFYGLQLAIEAARPYLHLPAAQGIRLALEVAADGARSRSARLLP